MNFCAKCGRERSGDARYCGGCGTEFAADSAAAGTPPTDDSGGGDPQPTPTVEAQAVTPAAAEPLPADATRVERTPDITVIDRPRAAEPARAATPAAAEPDPFAAWFAPDAQAAPRTDPAGQRQAAQPWQSADTVYAGSGQRPAAYPPPSPTGPGYPPPYGAQPGPPAGRKRSSGGRKAAFIVAVALVMLAAGGGAYALVSRSGKQTAAPPARPTAVSSATPTAPSSATASSSPTAAASATAAATAPSVPSLVSLGSGVAATGAEPAVETTLSRYFQGINTHNYAEYQSAHNPHEQAIESESDFNSGYGSTQDSGMTLTSLVSTASGESATVTFTSHQDKGTGIDGSACNNWQLTYFLVPQGTGYLIGPAPAGYKPVYSDC